MNWNELDWIRINCVNCFEWIPNSSALNANVLSTSVPNKNFWIYSPPSHNFDVITVRHSVHLNEVENIFINEMTVLIKNVLNAKYFNNEAFLGPYMHTVGKFKHLPGKLTKRNFSVTFCSVLPLGAHRTSIPGFIARSVLCDRRFCNVTILDQK